MSYALRSRNIASAVVAALGLAGCSLHAESQMAATSGFEVPETGAVLLDWRVCGVEHPCFAGEADGQKFALGFDGAASRVAGRVGARNVALALDATSIFRLGDSALDMLYASADGSVVLAVTWNEASQQPIDCRLVTIHAGL